MRAGAKLAPNLRNQGVRFGQLADDAQKWSEEFHPKGIRALKGRIIELKEEFGERPAADLTPQIIDRWLTEQTEWSPATKPIPSRNQPGLSTSHAQWKDSHESGASGGRESRERSPRTLPAVEGGVGAKKGYGGAV